MALQLGEDVGESAHERGPATFILRSTSTTAIVLSQAALQQRYRGVGDAAGQYGPMSILARRARMGTMARTLGSPGLTLLTPGGLPAANGGGGYSEPCPGQPRQRLLGQW